MYSTDGLCAHFIWRLPQCPGLPIRLPYVCVFVWVRARETVWPMEPVMGCTNTIKTWLPAFLPAFHFLCLSALSLFRSSSFYSGWDVLSAPSLPICCGIKTLSHLRSWIALSWRVSSSVCTHTVYFHRRTLSQLAEGKKRLMFLWDDVPRSESRL